MLSCTKTTSPRTFKTVIYSRNESEERITKIRNIEIKKQYLEKLDFSVFQPGNKLNRSALEYVITQLESMKDKDSDYQLGVLSQQMSKYMDSPIRNEHFAFHCFGRAADNGHAAAQCKLGEIYLKGIDASFKDPAIQQNSFLAAYWLKAAKQQDNPKAKYLYAEHFLKPNLSTDELKHNQKTPVDTETYEVLLHEAAQVGYALAYLKLVELNNESNTDRIDALQDVVNLFTQGNPCLSIEPDPILAMSYYNQYKALISNSDQTCLPNQPLQL